MPSLYQPSNPPAVGAAAPAPAGAGAGQQEDAPPQQADQQPPQQHDAPAVIDLTGEPPFKPAAKRITSVAELRQFLEGPSAHDFVAFMLHVNEACKGRKLSQLSAEPSPAVQQLVALLSTLSAWVADIPPVEQSLRYGNPAFRTWHAR